MFLYIFNKNVIFAISKMVAKQQFLNRIFLLEIHDFRLHNRRENILYE